MRFFSMLGRTFLGFVEEVGGVFILQCRITHIWPRGFRNLRNLLVQMEKIGTGSIPLVLVTSLFVGAVTAVQAAYQFQGFVPLRYIGAVVGKSVTLELGPVLTALVVGGRVSAAIAAELGTMKVTEQIDAMEMIAIDPVEYLVIPRIAAATLMLPVLAVFSDFLAILGGMIVGVGMLDIDMIQYLNQTQKALNLTHFWIGIVHAVVFGILVALAGCLRGIQCGRSASAVGNATTSAVVSSIVAIVVATAIITVVCNMLGI